MIFFLIFMAIYLFVAVYPLMWLARISGSVNYGFGSCLFALILSTVASIFLCIGVKDPVVSIPVSFLTLIFSLKFCLGTRFFASLIITTLYNVVGFIFAFLVFSALGIHFSDIYAYPAY